MSRDAFGQPIALATYRDHLARLARLSTEAERALYRKAATRHDPLMFALLYLGRHLKGDATGGRITLSEVHLAWAEAAKSWMVPADTPQADRHAEIAPREMGKSTWWFLLLPMWAAAHGWVRFAAAFAATPGQAETHLASFKAELDNNPIIRYDYPDLVAPKTRGRGQVEADRVSLYHARSGFVFAASGIDASNLGIKVGDQRPDLIVLDDIEPHEARYSAALAKKRLDTLRSAILPLNVRAHVVIVGTVTMPGSIIHQLVRSAQGVVLDDDERWIEEEKITAHHYAPILTNDDGSRRSVWPEAWSLEWLASIEHTRTYAKNYANDPRGIDGDYWTLDDIETGDLPGVTRVLVSVDPAVTTKGTSDYTAIAVIGWQPPPRDRPKAPGRCIVLEVRQVKLSGAALRLDLIETLGRHNAGLVYIESNQGGDLWLTVLWGMPVKVKTVHQTEAKEVRAADTLDHYQRGRVVHAEGADLAQAEAQLVAFPNAPHDDMVDAIGSGVRYFLNRNRRRKVTAGGSSEAYT